MAYGLKACSCHPLICVLPVLPNPVWKLVVGLRQGIVNSILEFVHGVSTQHLLADYSIGWLFWRWRSTLEVEAWCSAFVFWTCDLFCFMMGKFFKQCFFAWCHWVFSLNVWWGEDSNFSVPIGPQRGQSRMGGNLQEKIRLKPKLPT